MTDKRYTDADFQQYLKEVTDGTVKLQCSIHLFSPGLGKMPPVFNCYQCNYAHIMWLYATTPPDKQGDMLDAFERAIRDACQIFDEGKWDLNLQEHPTVTIE